MNTKRTLTVTLPDGTIATRTTARTYTQAVAVFIPAADEVARELEFAADCDGWGQHERAEQRRAEAARLAAEGDRWAVFGWASRPDLAVKTADTARKHRATVRILEVNA